MTERLTRPKNVALELLVRIAMQGMRLRDEVIESATPEVLVDSFYAWDRQVRKLLDGLFTGKYSEFV